MTSNTPQDEQVTQEDRLIRIESALAHIQQDIDALNASLLKHLQIIRAFEGRCSRIEAAVEQITDPGEPRDPALEQPPHY